MSKEALSQSHSLERDVDRIQVTLNHPADFWNLASRPLIPMSETKEVRLEFRGLEQVYKGDWK